MSDPPQNPAIHFFLCVSYLFVFLATIIGNLIILLVFASQKKVRSVPNFFLANLTVADLFVGIFCVLQNGVHYMYQGDMGWPFGKMLCYSYIYVLHFIPNVSAGILVLVSIERLIAVLRPLRVRRAFSHKVLVTSSAFVWITSAIMNIPFIMTSRFQEFRDNTTTLVLCGRSALFIGGFNVLKVTATVNFIVWYAVPAVILLCIYATIGLVVSKAATITKHSANKLLPRSSWRSEASTGGVSVEKRRKVGRLAVGIVVAFAFLSLPRHLWLLWIVWRDNNDNRSTHSFFQILHPITFLLLFFNSAINPFLYAFLSTRFRQSIKETFNFGKVRECNIELSSRLRRKVEVDTTYDYQT
ncbi:unnamed protein product [Caenorhabditis angaria]|uniref:G-protein coupled receptors family 1 profile domain-containing protein n=1 Tax=Caenorhabditis angaria TaxID=860376 RepID=A0A9P1J2I2_9PELO|nr:unnamed protein product [Caenorhabditis angaria]